MPPGIPLSKEHKEKLSLAWDYNKHFTPEVRKKLSLSNSKPKSVEAKKRMKGHCGVYIRNKSVWNKGLKTGPISEEHKGKISMRLKDSKLSEEHKQKIKQNHSHYWKGKVSAIKGREFPKGKYPKWGWRTSRENQIIPVKDTKIEIKIQNYLKELGIEFFTHQYIKEIKHGYQCDILIPSLNLVIECDGNYWHKYPIGNDIDHIRTKELLEKGFKVLRLWEFEIKNLSLNQFKNKLILLSEIK